MRKAIFFFPLLPGIVLSAFDNDWGLQLIMMFIGAMFGSAIGGYSLSQIGKPHPKGCQLRRLRAAEKINPILGIGMSGWDIVANCWRDKWLPPYTRMSNAEPDKHMFDLDRIG